MASRHQAASPSPAQRQLIDRRTTMSKLTRTLILGATLAAMNLAGMTAVAHAEANHDPDGENARRPPTERQVGEAWRKHPVTSHQEKAAEATLGRVLARERHSIPNASPTEAPAPVPPKQGGQPGRLTAWLGGLVAAVLLAGGLGVMASRRTRRRARLEHAA
jgi:hypothetical protein